MHDWQSTYEVLYPDYTCSKCGAVITGRETACKPMDDTRVGTDQVPELRHLPVVLDGNGDPVPMLSCEEVSMAIVMMS